jgi:nucleoside-diphosphate-sugar epimerase
MDLLTGGRGYVGSVLVPALLQRGRRVRVLDAKWFGDKLRPSPGLEVVEGDIRDPEVVRAALQGVQSVVHLAVLSNDPSTKLDEALTVSLNRDAAIRLIEEVRSKGVRRFVNTSTTTAYGVREEPEVHEDVPHRLITLYGRAKPETPRLAASPATADSAIVSLRPATVCGLTPHMRLALQANVLTCQAVLDGGMTLHGGAQMRSTVAMGDVVAAFVAVPEADAATVSGRAYNVGGMNHSVRLGKTNTPGFTGSMSRWSGIGLARTLTTRAARHQRAR